MNVEEQLAQVRLDMAELAEQVRIGEMEKSDADELLVRYRAEEATLTAILDKAPLDGASPVDPDNSNREGTGGSPSRVWWLTATMVAVLAAVGFFVTQSISDRPEGGFVTGNLDTGRDLESVSNEEMEATVAQFPDVVGMRVALARRYFEEGSFSDATRHYLEVLDREPNHPEALANLGWITFVSDGGPEADAAAESLLERSLMAQPGNPDALFFLANLRLAEGDGPGAADLLNRLLESGAVGEEDRALVDGLLDEASRLS